MMQVESKYIVAFLLEAQMDLLLFYCDGESGMGELVIVNIKVFV